MKNRTLNCQLFFSKTNDFLSYYLPCQAARSIHTIETYRDGLTVFRRYMTNVQKISIKSFCLLIAPVNLCWIIWDI